MVEFSRLTIRNFKRFSGEHHIPLSGDGRVTVVAAQNGLGKTTMMDAIHVGLYGKRGFTDLYPEKEFLEWLSKAHSVDADDSGSIVLALAMEDPVLGNIRVSRTYWILDESMGGIEEEVSVSINGKPLERESGETRVGLAERWIEDYLPHAAMRRFLVDGERLSDLDPKRIDRDIVRGIDDATGIGLLHKLKRHLESVKRGTLRTLAPEDQAESIERLLEMKQELIESKRVAEEELEKRISQMDSDSRRIVEIQDEIENLTRDGGSENVQLRMDYAIKQSELTSSRREVHQHLMEAIPFIVAGVPANLSEWEIEDALESKRSAKRVEEHMQFLDSVIDNSEVGKITRNRLMTSGRAISDKMGYEGESGSLTHLTLGALEELIQRHAELGLYDAAERVSDCMDEAVERLENFENSEQALRKATAGTGISNKADKLRDLAKGIGTLQAEIARLKGEVAQQEQGRLEVEKLIDEIRQREDSDSLLNQRLSRIDELERLTDLVMSSVREAFAEPLEAAFQEGFELLSRKSGRLEGVAIDTQDYSTNLSMRGFEGNWLDRDLSATERQHVGLALVYALRRASTEWSLPLPVVIDTPTSRMDTEHKSWSVTKFYPQLSNQVVVFATSDDLSGGLFEELSESGVLGHQLLVQEISENSVEVVPSDLGVFFGV